MAFDQTACKCMQTRPGRVWWCFSLFVCLVETGEIHVHCKKIRKLQIRTKKEVKSFVSPLLRKHIFLKSRKTIANIVVYSHSSRPFLAHTSIVGKFFSNQNRFLLHILFCNLLFLH